MNARLFFAVVFLFGVSGCVTSMRYGQYRPHSSETTLGGWYREPRTNQPTDCTTTVTKTGQPIPGTLQIRWDGGTARQVCVAKSDPRNSPSSQFNQRVIDLKQNVDGVNSLIDSIRSFDRY